ncbi:hypothetical protein L596_000312 [Steinernema carpocapsae]|uniref:Uncharacterized protein n=1 Tax=Steinernema carpocapsae TaxID=34508 RepID=A0A4U8UHS2_STECR|nr:hypothetical protein L596_000312 [Steinernema carpocapsae]
MGCCTRQPQRISVRPPQRPPHRLPPVRPFLPAPRPTLWQRFTALWTKCCCGCCVCGCCGCIAHQVNQTQTVAYHAEKPTRY